MPEGSATIHADCPCVRTSVEAPLMVDVVGVTVTVPRGAWFEYKYARGAWNSVEKWPGCAEASNRYAFGAVHALDWDHAGKDDEVWQWADLCP